MSAGGDHRCCLCCPGLWVTRLRLAGAVVFGLWNNLSTLYNAKTLYASVSLFIELYSNPGSERLRT